MNGKRLVLCLILSRGERPPSSLAKFFGLGYAFRPEDVQRWRDWGVRGGEESGLTHWRPSNRFFDSEASAGRGIVELMAIQRRMRRRVRSPWQ